MKKILAITALLGLFSCVPARKYEELKAKQTDCDKQLTEMKSKFESMETSNKELTSKLSTASKDLLKTEAELLTAKRNYKEKEEQYETLSKLYKDIQEQLEKKNSLNQKENQILAGELESTRARLHQKEDDLRALEKELSYREQALKEKEARVQELEAVIAKKDSAVSALKDKVANALLGFKDKGLTVEERNGRVYVSMEAKLLFASGSINVDPKGKQAIIDLARALEDQNDLDIIVEGHTDTDALKSSTHPKDNWELSVLRATSVVKIMLENSNMDAKTISASGRSEFLPVDPFDKAKNRRIEVILTPNLNELYELISK